MGLNLYFKLIVSQAFWRVETNTLIFLSSPRTECTSRLPQQDCLANIARQSGPGGVNQYWQPNNVDMIGLDRALYFSGVTDRLLVRVLQGIILVALLGAVAWQVRGPRALPAAAAWSLTALFSMLFLYHRTYDMPVLMIPLMYSLGRARAERGWCRWCYAACGAAVLVLLYFRYETVNQFCINPPLTGWLGTVARAVIIPHVVWLLLAAMALLSAAEYLRRKREDVVADAPQYHADRVWVPTGDRFAADSLMR